MPAQIIPLTNAPNQSLSVSLNIDGTTKQLNLVLRFNEMGGWWTMTILDHNNNLVLDSVPLLTGAYPAANILAPYAYLGIGSAYIINASSTTQDWPDNTNLGTDFLLLWDDTV